MHPVSIEIEFRSRYDQAKHDQLLRYLGEYSEAWGHDAEFEVLLDDGADEGAMISAVTRIQDVASRLGVQSMTEAELAEFTATFERARAGKQVTS